jgi:hypothetical protein
MRILLFTEWFSEGMGYSENYLPKALSDLDHKVHIVSSIAQIYFNSANYKTIYEFFLGHGIVD